MQLENRGDASAQKWSRPSNATRYYKAGMGLLNCQKWLEAYKHSLDNETKQMETVKLDILSGLKLIDLFDSKVSSCRWKTPKLKTHPPTHPQTSS